MDLAVVMSREVLTEKLEDGRARRRKVATWNTRRVRGRLTPGWTNRLYVACGGCWCGSFPLSGDVVWESGGRGRALCPHLRPPTLEVHSA